MIIEWTPDLTVGIEAIDAQHRRIFEIADDLLVAMRSGKGRSEVSAVLDFLGQYVLEHFSLEERAMGEIGDSNYRVHKAEHEEFIGRFEGLKGAFASGGASTAFVLQVNNLVCGWLRNHIAKLDPTIREAVEKHGGVVDAFAR